MSNSPKMMLNELTKRRQPKAKFNLKQVIEKNFDDAAAPTIPVAINLSEEERLRRVHEGNLKLKSLPLLKIHKSVLSLYSWKEMESLARVMIVSNAALEGSGSVNDERMGSTSDQRPCQYCRQIDCPGHFGLIEFKGYIYNPSFIREVVSVLTCVCNSCGGLLMSKETIYQQGFNRLSLNKRLKEMEKFSKCLDCIKRKDSTELGARVKNCEKNPIFVTTNLKEFGTINYKLVDEMCKPIQEKADPLSIEIVAQILDSISDSDALLLGFSKGRHPRDLLLRGILVPPNIARPPIIENGIIRQDALSMQYVEIFKLSKNYIEKKENSEFQLYNALNQLIIGKNEQKIGYQDSKLVSIFKQIQGKEALMRRLLMGKRVNYCSRTLAAGDPALQFGEISYPMIWAGIQTKKYHVIDLNINYLNRLLQEGKISYIIDADIGSRKAYDRRFSYNLKIGDIVEAHLKTGDRISVNRQPTLHKQSMMAYRVVLKDQLTVGVHLSVTSPMNCDFDGDEINQWNGQSYEVEAEFEYLMNVTENIMSAEQNRPIMGLVMNSNTGAYIISKDDVFVSDSLFTYLTEMISNRDRIATLAARLQKYAIHPRSGKAVFSALLPADFYFRSGNQDNIAANEVVICEGILIQGRLTKNHVGASHRSIIQELYKKYGSHVTSQFFTESSWVLNKWLIESGFTVGMHDIYITAVDPETGLEYDKNRRILEDDIQMIYLEIEALGGKRPDSFEEEVREKRIIDKLNIAKELGEKLAKQSLTENNAISIMTSQGAGTKGNFGNIGQINGAVAQQFLQGDRIQETITNNTRCLPHFDRNSTNPEARGFIPYSFTTGLDPKNLYFLHYGGREGLLDTALKTAETGDMQRSMIKAFENIVIGYDGSIRNTIGTMFAPIFNSGYEISHMLNVTNKEKITMPHFIDVARFMEECNVKRGWVKQELKDTIIQRRKKLESQLVNFKDRILPQKKYTFPNLFNKKADLRKVPEVKETLLKLNKFEKSRVVGIRATQLSRNALPLVDIPDEYDLVTIAKQELEAGLLNQMFILRKYPNGQYDKIYCTKDNL